MNTKYFIFILFCFFLIGVSYYGLSKWMVVKEIQLELKQEPTWDHSEEEIRKKLLTKLQKFIGKKIWQVSFDDLMQDMRSEPRVGPIKILRLLPNRFFIQVQSRKPLLVLLNSSKNTIHPLSMDGQVLPPLSADQIPNLPILRGPIFLKKIEVRKQAINFLSLMPEQGDFSHQEVSEIRYSHQEKSLIFILSKNGKSIKVGYDPTQMKTKRIESVLRYLDQKSIKWRVIDARFSQKIVVTTSKAI